MACVVYNGLLNFEKKYKLQLKRWMKPYITQHGLSSGHQEQRQKSCV